MLRQLLKARGRKGGESMTKEEAGCWEDNYDMVKEINDKRHSGKKKKSGNVKKERGEEVGGKGQCAVQRVY
jgi:hypothetical protein